MSTILHIETSTNACSVAVSEDTQVIFQQEDHTGPNHAEKLGTFVDEALSFTDNHAIPFDAVAVSCGPGSYTGLRIGVSMAKGICYARDLKLIAVPTLELLCVPVLLGKMKDMEELEDDALLCPMLDARRMEVYAAIYDRALRPVRETGADIVDANTYREYLDQHPVYFFGNGQSPQRPLYRRCRTVGKMDAASRRPALAEWPDRRRGLLCALLSEGFRGQNAEKVDLAIGSRLLNRKNEKDIWTSKD